MPSRISLSHSSCNPWPIKLLKFIRLTCISENVIPLHIGLILSNEPEFIYYHFLKKMFCKGHKHGIFKLTFINEWIEFVCSDLQHDTEEIDNLGQISSYL